MKFYKKDLIEKVSEDTGFYKSDVEITLDAILKIIPKMLDDNDSLFLYKFGTFSNVIAKEKIGRNPKTKEQVIIPKHNKLKFKVSEVIYND
jgi:DNA-binding protein HU-beta